MNIVFLCGSLQAGCDGVGDYTRRLAGEVIRQGHEASIAAINDKFIKKTIGEFQEDGSEKISVLRVPSIETTSRKYAEVGEWINSINPDLLSLQYVPFSFNDKGLHFGMGKELKKIGKGRIWQIMFHELWVGMPEKASLKHVVWGNTQRHLIRRLILELNPKIIHTQSNLFLIQLNKLGFNAEHLPLFTNIPAVKNPRDKRIKSDKVKLVIFGSVYPNSRIDEFINAVNEYKSQNNSDFDLTFIGRNGSESKDLITAWQITGMGVITEGEQNPKRISEVLSAASIGIATGAPAMVEKNGSVAAMLQHNLPVLCIGHDWKPRGIGSITLPKGVFALEKGCFDNILSRKVVYTAPSISEVAKQFLEVL